MPRVPATKLILPGGAELFRPSVLVSVVVGNKGVRGQAIVDSGADTTLVPAEWVAPLGVDFYSLPPGPASGGVGGGLETRPCTGRVQYERWVVAQPFMVAEPKKLDITLLGRADFFRLFVVRFHWHKSPPVFDLDPVVPSKGK